MFTNLFFSLFIFPWRNYTNSKSNNECLLEREERSPCAIQTEWIEKNVNRHHRAVISLSESKHEIALHSLHFVLFCNRYKLREWRMGNEFIFCHVKVAHLHKKSFKNSNYLSSRNTNGVERDGKQQKNKECCKLLQLICASEEAWEDEESEETSILCVLCERLKLT